MKRIDLEKAMNPVNMAMITDEENNTFYDVNRLYMYEGKLQEKIVKTTIKCTLKGTKEEKDEVVEKFVGFMEQLNLAFNRSVGAPESMKLFKVLDTQSRYAGNETIAVELTMATLATGSGSVVHTLLYYIPMSVNVWGTECNIIETRQTTLAEETYGLGNALRSWKAVMKKYSRPERHSAIQFQPLYLEL